MNPMTPRQRFSAVWDYRPFDRLPVYYFGLWAETQQRWLREGLDSAKSIESQTGMDQDWEAGLWRTHGLAHYRPIFDEPEQLLEETAEYRIVRNPAGAVLKVSKLGDSIPQHLQEAMPPTRQGWQRFRKALDVNHPQRRADAPALAAKAAELNARDTIVACFGGSLYGDPRDWMGVEAISLLRYDDPALYEEIIDTLTHHYIAVNEPILKQVHCDLAYFFEDCCGKSGPLYSPATYRQFYHKSYSKLCDFYHRMGVKHVMIDSDGDVDLLIGAWLDSGFDIIFPIEIGTWQADPLALRQRFGKRLRMFGGVDKNIIPQGPEVIRAHLARLKPLVDEGGFIPIPDHRIPPQCSLEDFRTYIRVFKEVFGITP